MNQMGKTNIRPQKREDENESYRMIAPTCDILVDYNWKNLN